MGSQAFFGLTMLGQPNPILDQNASTYAYPFHQVDLDKYQEVFSKYLIGACNVATVLEVDGDEHILRASLGDMLRDLLGRQPRRFELQAWFTYLDFDRSSVMSLSEYCKATEELRAFSATPTQPKQYTSYEAYRTHHVKHARREYELQSSLKAPLTVQQEIGWHAKKPASTSDVSFPLNRYVVLGPLK